MKDRGFTLIELLVVIAIVSLLSSIVLASVNAAREKARVSERNQIVEQYRHALEMARVNNGAYPVSVTAICLGNYPDGCGGAFGYTHNAAVNAALAPHIPSLPQIPAASAQYSGLMYWTCPGYSSCSTWNVPNDTYVLAWLHEGTDKSCGIGTVSSANFNGHTYCRYVHR